MARAKRMKVVGLGKTQSFLDPNSTIWIEFPAGTPPAEGDENEPSLSFKLTRRPAEPEKPVEMPFWADDPRNWAPPVVDADVLAMTDEIVGLGFAKQRFIDLALSVLLEQEGLQGKQAGLGTARELVKTVVRRSFGGEERVEETVPRWRREVDGLAKLRKKARLDLKLAKSQFGMHPKAAKKILALYSREIGMRRGIIYVYQSTLKKWEHYHTAQKDREPNEGLEPIHPKWRRTGKTVRPNLIHFIVELVTFLAEVPVTRLPQRFAIGWRPRVSARGTSPYTIVAEYLERLEVRKLSSTAEDQPLRSDTENRDGVTREKTFSSAGVGNYYRKWKDKLGQLPLTLIAIERRHRQSW